MAGFIELNGQKFSFTSAEVDFNGARFFGMVALNWKEEMSAEDVYGNAVLPEGDTVGQYKGTGDLEMLLAESDRLLAKLGPSYTLRRFNIGVNYIEGVRLSTVEIVGARIISQEVSNARGPAATTRKFGLHLYVPVRQNGLTIYEDPSVQATIGAALTLSL